jgi:hypothetical protein
MKHLFLYGAPVKLSKEITPDCKVLQDVKARGVPELRRLLSV